MRYKNTLPIAVLGLTTLSAFALDEQTVGRARAQLLRVAPGAQIYEPGTGQMRVYGAQMSSGDSPTASAEQFLLENAGVFGIQADDLERGSHLVTSMALETPVMVDEATGAAKFLLVNYSQVNQGLPVFRSEISLLVRNEPGFPVVWVGSTLRNLVTTTVALPVDPAGAAQSVSEEDVQLRATGDSGWSIAANNLPGLMIVSDPEPVIFAGVEGENVAPVRASVFLADNGQPNTPNYQKFLYVVDATTGRVLYQENQILNTDVTGNVSGLATTGFAADACNAEVATPLPYAKVSIGATTAYADVNGNFSIPNAGTTAVNVNSDLTGQYFRVINNGGSNASLTLNVTPPGPANFVHNSANNTEAYRAQVNGYLQANIVHDFVLHYAPSFPVISTQVNFPVNVMLASTCNAFFDGGSINFYQAGGGCNDTAFSVVVHHEYGHNVVQSGGSGQGAYGEGTGDCLGVLISDDPVLAYGFNTGQCNTGIRTASNTIQYPCSGEIHTCGQLISGCVWETRNELRNTNPGTYRDLIAGLCVNAIALHRGSNIDPSICIDYLTLDDNDGDLSNGTPHYTEINTGFTRHSMGVPMPLSCTEITGFTGRCGRFSRAVQFTLTLANSSHNGQTVTMAVDGVNHTVTINGNTASFNMRRTSGQHTAVLVDPAGCNRTATAVCP